MEIVKRKYTRPVKVGNVQIGGCAPVSVQSMTSTKTSDIKATTGEIHRLENAGCQIVRVAVPDEAAADAIEDIRKEINIPLVADIHFNYRLALRSVERGVDKIRINPGNIGSEERVKAILNSAGERGIPIRIGVNAGSLENDLLNKYGYPTPEAMVESACRHIEICEKYGFKDIVISLKSSDVNLMIEANRIFSKRYDYPLHLGVTESGTFRSGSIRSSIGIGSLLSEGIGDTIRVSLTEDVVREVEVGREILKSLGFVNSGVTIVSCPTCGRLEVDLIGIVNRVEQKVGLMKKAVKVAIMGCAVNGPGEAKDADIGVACGRGGALLFKDGEVIQKIDEGEIVDRLVHEIERY